MDTFTIYENNSPAPVDASEGKVRRLLNAGGDPVHYRTDPGVSFSDPSLSFGESTKLTDRVWLRTAGLTKVLVEG
jgi:hypothetical protein